MICKFCKREIGMFDMFNSYMEQAECCEQCLEKEIEKGNLEILKNVLGIEEGEIENEY